MTARPPSVTVSTAPDAERAAVGAALFDGTALPILRPLFEPEHLHDSTLRVAYKAGLALADRGLPVNFVSVSEELRRTQDFGHVAAVGGEAWLAELTTDGRLFVDLGAAPLEHFAGLIRQAHADRRMAALGPRLEAARQRGDHAAVAKYARELEQLALAGKVGGPRLRTVLMDEVQPEVVRWLWHGRIPYAMLSLVEGEPDQGKSTVLLDLAARVTTGRPLPGDAEDEARAPGNVILWAPEDPAPQVIRPRLGAAEADLQRVRLITDGLTLPDDAPRLAELVKADQAQLLIIEPLTAALGGKVDSYKDHDVRRALMPLVELAAAHGCAVVAIRHLRKGDGPAIHRGGGSIAISALARSVLAVGRDPSDREARVLARTKGNLAQLPPALRYRFVSCGHVARVEWMGECQITADELLQPAQPQEKRKAPALIAAMDVVRQLLADGPMLAGDLEEQALAADVAVKTLRRAKEALGVRARAVKGTSPVKWMLSLPLGEMVKMGEGQDGQV